MGPAGACVRADRGAVLWGASGTDRPDAQRVGRASSLAFGRRFFARAVLVHVAARARGDAAGDLCRMAAARHPWGAVGGAFVCASRGCGHSGAGLWLCLFRPASLGSSRVHGDQGGGHCRGLSSLAQSGTQSVARARGMGAGRAGLCGAVRLRSAFPANHSGRGPLGRFRSHRARQRGRD